MYTRRRHTVLKISRWDDVTILKSITRWAAMGSITRIRRFLRGNIFSKLTMTLSPLWLNEMSCYATSHFSIATLTVGVIKLPLFSVPRRNGLSACQVMACSKLPRLLSKVFSGCPIGDERESTACWRSAPTGASLASAPGGSRLRYSCTK